MARIKPRDKLPQLQSWDDVDLALCEIGEHERAVEAAQAKMQQAIDEAKLQAKDDSAAHLSAIESLSQQVREYAEGHRSELSKKTKPLMCGNIGWRKSTKLTVPKDESKRADIVRLLRALGWHDCIKIEQPKINREALRTHPLEEVVKLGIGVSVEDEFWLDTRKEAIPTEGAGNGTA